MRAVSPWSTLSRGQSCGFNSAVAFQVLGWDMAHRALGVHRRILVGFRTEHACCTIAPSTARRIAASLRSASADCGCTPRWCHCSLPIARDAWYTVEVGSADGDSRNHPESHRPAGLSPCERRARGAPDCGAESLSAKRFRSASVAVWRIARASASTRGLELFPCFSEA